MQINIHRRFNRLFLGSTAPLILLALSHPVSAGDMDTGRHSLIHRPPSQSSPSTKPKSSLSRSRPSAQPASPATPSLPLHHKLTKKPTVLSSALAPTTSIAATGSPQRSTSPSPSGSPPVETAPATQAKPIATVPILSSVLGAAAVPSARTASAAQSVAAASSGTTSTQLPGSMQRLLQTNPSFASLLQAPTPVVSTPPPAPPTPPATPPPSTPPAPPPPTPTTGSATLTWTANGEPDLAGYKVYVGTVSGTYNFSGSPFTVGKVTTYTVTNLPRNNTYFFAISAYDSAGNEGPLSAEVSKSIF